ncbi:MAG: hypothetical protein RL685_5004 [Pseudomonadota bacterium]|jgi:hypothetical protein
MVPSPLSITLDEKRAALERVLQSRALGRADQLRALLRFVCEAEFAGRAHDLNEYTLGVTVLRRPTGYSPAEDSCVRSRAYELRSRLRAYYEEEAPEDPVRIEIERGGYVPRFERSSVPLWEAQEKPAAARLMTPELLELWEPFLTSEAPLLITFDVRLFFHAPATGLVIRDYLINNPADVAQSEPLMRFQLSMGTDELRETRDYADFGAVHAAFLLGRLLAGSRLDVGLKHSASLDWQDLWNNNLVFIGKPNLSPISRSFLENKELTTDDDGVIRIAKPREGEALEYVSAETHGLGDKYALITRVPGPQAGRHVLLLSGAGAELMWALAECVTNPEHVAELLSHVRLPSGEPAESFQIVIQATFQANVPLRIRYVTHRVLGLS